ncbi:vesicle-associated membrane protein 7 [Condylostylus longicornis]|uniref:vesicle-associated membrane protein 7 n=1 Tax=Condylostylus longicornis TaxID=2530218 RepID=UPI00244E41B8|nr:vesicle-associated membrane protein 7 [Condylostylus longicornis]XP_055383159.1 vesicle-associated membrane protein 7 [Condylostylus longicornis]
MPILYSVIARETTVLAKFAEVVGNFAEVTEQILKKIQPCNHKLTYTYNNYRIHYECENKIIYMCFADDDFAVVRAFLFLSDIKKKFISTYGLQVATAIAYAMNSEFSKVLAQQMSYFNESNDIDSITQIHGNIDELQDILVKNIDSLKDRGERLELLVNKTENLRNNTVTFRKTSRNLARAMFWKNFRMYIIFGCILLFILYVIISMACGGLAWQSCIHKN